MENAGSGEWMSMPSASEQQLKELFLSDKNHPALRLANLAIKMKRSPHQVCMLLFGLSGAGKKSTVDYLLGTNVGETMKSRSDARSTIEYTMKLKSNELRISDIPLSIINTPSFCDGDGLEQDAKNVMSIKYYLDSNLYNLNRYPNLVMIILNIMDHRITGHNSDFVKMLKVMRKLNAIDISSPNAVVVLTHAMGIALNPKRWEEKVEMKKAQVRAIVQDYLEINPEIVVLENEPDDNDLKRDGYWYILPNGDRQPKILYQACKKVLIEAKDEIGHAAITVCFQPGVDKHVGTGQITQSSDVKMEDTQAMRMILLNLEETVFTSEVGSMLENYKKQKIAKEIVNDIFFLQVRFGDLGISRICDLQSMSTNTLVANMYPTKIKKKMQIALEEVFGLSNEQKVDLNPANQYELTDIAPSNGSLSQEDNFEMISSEAKPFNSSACFPEDSLVMLHNQ